MRYSITIHYPVSVSETLIADCIEGGERLYHGAHLENDFEDVCYVDLSEDELRGTISNLIRLMGENEGLAFTVQRWNET